MINLDSVGKIVILMHTNCNIIFFSNYAQSYFKWGNRKYLLIAFNIEYSE